MIYIVDTRIVQLNNNTIFQCSNYNVFCIRYFSIQSLRLVIFWISSMLIGMLMYVCVCKLLRTRQQARVNACDIDTSHTDVYDNSITHNWIFVRARIINGKSRPASKTYLQLPYEHEKLSCNFWSLLIPVLRYKSNIIAIEYNLYNTRFLSISLHLVYVSFVACTHVVRVRFMVGPCYRTYQY